MLHGSYRLSRPGIHYHQQGFNPTQVIYDNKIRYERTLKSDQNKFTCTVISKEKIQDLHINYKEMGNVHIR